MLKEAIEKRFGVPKTPKSYSLEDLQFEFVPLESKGHQRFGFLGQTISNIASARESILNYAERTFVGVQAGVASGVLTSIFLANLSPEFAIGSGLLVGGMVARRALDLYDQLQTVLPLEY